MTFERDFQRDRVKGSERESIPERKRNKERERESIPEKRERVHERKRKIVKEECSKSVPF